MSLDLRNLELFIRVAKLGAIGRAGAEFGLSATSASQRIKALENDLGVTLLNRTTRSISLTDDGSVLVEHAEQILQNVEAVRTRLSRSNTSVTGLLRVTASATFARFYVVPATIAFLRNHPQVELDLSLSDKVVDVVAEGVDLAFRFGELAPSTLLAQKICDNPRWLVASPEYLERAGTPSTPEELSQHTCVPLGRNRTWRLEGNDGILHDITPTSRVNVNLGDAVAAWVRGCLGIGQAALWHAGPDLRAGRLVHVLPSYRLVPDVNLWAVRPPGVMPERVRAFLSHMETHIRATNEARYGELIGDSAR